MGEYHLIKNGERCRVRARAAENPANVLKIAERFEEIASIAAARRAVEETRCW